jgi:hypothetical protein
MKKVINKIRLLANRLRLKLKNFLKLKTSFQPNQAQLNAIVEVLRDIAQILFASLVIDPLLKIPINWILVFLGILSSGVFWYTNLIISKSIKSYA